MATRTITLTEALSELKLLDKKIKKKQEELYYGKPVVDYTIGKNQVTEINNITVNELKKHAQSTIDSLLRLIKNREILKSKIAQKNAETTVVIGGKEYTIVAAIERKRNLSNEKEIIERLADTYNSILQKVQKINEKAREQVDKLIETKVGSDSKNTDPKVLDEMYNMFLANSQATLQDPYNVRELVEKMSEDIDNFEKEVDVKLSIVNAKTTIEIDFDEE